MLVRIQLWALNNFWERRWKRRKTSIAINFLSRVQFTQKLLDQRKVRRVIVARILNWMMSKLIQYELAKIVRTHIESTLVPGYFQPDLTCACAVSSWTLWRLLKKQGVNANFISGRHIGNIYFLCYLSEPRCIMVRFHSAVLFEGLVATSFSLETYMPHHKPLLLLLQRIEDKEVKL